jgi:hypothetical protein
MNLVPGRKTVVVVIGEAMTEKEIDSALASITPRSLDALVQLIEYYRQDYMDKAATHADRNNPLAMARENGASEALGNLITVLNDRRQQAD